MFDGPGAVTWHRVRFRAHTVVGFHEDKVTIGGLRQRLANPGRSPSHSGASVSSRKTRQVQVSGVEASARVNYPGTFKSENTPFRAVHNRRQPLGKVGIDRSEL